LGYHRGLLRTYELKPRFIVGAATGDTVFI
jgi:hypothetical protein